MATKKCRVAVAALTITILATAVTGRAAAPGAGEVLAGLQAWLDGTRDLECRFEQTLLSGAFGVGVRERGRLYVKRPGKMRWEYTQPDPKVAILSDDATFLYLPEDHQMIRGEESWSSSPLLVLLSREGRIADVFEVEELDAAESGGPRQLRMVPREEGQGFVEVIVTVTSPGHAMAEAEVLDESGNRMHYRFRSMRRNRGVSDNLFVLEIPPGTEILGPS